MHAESKRVESREPRAKSTKPPIESRRDQHGHRAEVLARYCVQPPRDFEPQRNMQRSKVHCKNKFVFFIIITSQNLFVIQTRDLNCFVIFTTL